MNRHILLAIAAATFVSHNPAFAQDPSTSAEQRAELEASGPEEFAQMAAISNLFEIESSRLALEKSQLDEVRQFAQRMIEDHTKASEELQIAADADGVTDVPQTLDARHQALMSELEQAAANEFDSHYIEIQGTAHLETVTLFESYSTQEGALADFAEKSLPTLQAHRTMVVELAG